VKHQLGKQANEIDIKSKQDTILLR